jgi:hypothetical protein
MPRRNSLRQCTQEVAQSSTRFVDTLLRYMALMHRKVQVRGVCDCERLGKATLRYKTTSTAMESRDDELADGVEGSIQTTTRKLASLALRRKLDTVGRKLSKLCLPCRATFIRVSPHQAAVLSTLQVFERCLHRELEQPPSRSSWTKHATGCTQIFT